MSRVADTVTDTNKTYTDIQFADTDIIGICIGIG